MSVSNSLTGPETSRPAGARAQWAQQLGTALNQLRAVPALLWRLEAQFRGVRLLGPVTFLGRPILSVAPNSEMVWLGDNHLYSAPRCNPLGNPQPCILRTLAPGAVLRLGRGVGLSGAVVCAALNIEIGDGTIVGSGAMIMDNDFHQREGAHGWSGEAWGTARAVRIGSGCFIGARAIILKGVTIGDRAVIGAGSVVTRDVPEGACAAGNPAAIIRDPKTP